MKTLGQLGELQLIRRLSRMIPVGETVTVGIGDDAAIVRPPAGEFDWVLTSDAVIEGRHFERNTPRAKIGHKAVGRALSDIAAMGATPLWILIDLVAPRRAPWVHIQQVYKGALSLCRRYGVELVGGDTTEGKALELHVFGVGYVARGEAVQRSGAEPGDLVYVTGELGGSALGRHLEFEPRVREGIWLRGWATAMIDVSDGLCRDLGHILRASRVGAVLYGARIPVSRSARRFGNKSLAHALYDGEDFELLFTIPSEKQSAFEKEWRATFRLACSHIGEIVPRCGLWLLDKCGRRKLEEGGYEHFRG